MSNWINTCITINNVEPGDATAAFFKGSESMKSVKKVQSSCWCTKLDWNKKTKTLAVMMKAPAIDITKHITVTYEDNTLEVLTFIIKLRNGTSI